MPRTFELGPSGELLELKQADTYTAIVPARTWGGTGTWLGEAFGGMWASHMTTEPTQNVLAFSAVYACIRLIAGDISKLQLLLLEQKDSLIWEEVTQRDSPFWPVLVKPNRYQTSNQFLNYWFTQKLIHGNSYVLIERDRRGIPSALYPLDPRLVTPLVAPDGEVYYRLSGDDLNGIEDQITVPESEIIHDRCECLFHHLCGVPPIYACAATTTQGIRIQSNSEVFFKNQSRPSGILTAPGKITDEQQENIKREFEKRYSGENVGRLFVTGGGLTYTAMDPIPAQQAQLIEQLEWTVEDVARAFGVPLHKIQAGNPTVSNAAQFDQEYYKQALQRHMEDAEGLLNHAFGLNKLGMKIQFDLEGLLRMDPLSRSERYTKMVQAAVMTPNEARFLENLPPLPGGDSAYLQEQNYSLEALAKRDAKDDPFAKNETKPSTPSPAPDDDEGDEKELEESLLSLKGLIRAREHAWLPAAD